MQGKLISETNTRSAEKKIRRAFSAYLGRRTFPRHCDTWFEHGQWWVIHNPTGRTWSVVDAEPGVDYSGIDFELVSEGDEEYY